MQTVSYKTSLTPLERLFVEKALELCNYGSLDSYRAKVTCPTYALNEFYAAANDMVKKKMKYFETFSTIRAELIDILTDDEFIDYGRMSKSYFIASISKIGDEEHLKSVYETLEHSVYYLLARNDGYMIALIDSIKKLINEASLKCKKHQGKEDCEPCIGCKILCTNKIESLTSVLVSEILNHGYSKEYIHKYILGIFSSISFNDAWEDFRMKIAGNHSVEMKVVFKLISTVGKFKKVEEEKLKQNVNENDLQYLVQMTDYKGNGIENWLKPSGIHRFVIFTVDALDYGQALKKAKTGLSNMLDLLYLGYSETKFDIDGSAVVCDESRPKKASLQSVQYKIDGLFKNTSDNYNYLRKSVTLIKSREFIANEVKDKIETAIRYLRSGSEALELEQKFLNYWIGLENVFSDNNIGSRTFERLVKHFTVSHAISYTKRNITEFHKDIHRLGVNKLLVNTDTSAGIGYLTKEEVYNQIIEMADDYPLLASRARYIKSHYLSHTDKREITLALHKKNLNRHLVRMYMIRNKLVHDAAIMQNIENITGNLRYYLTFILNKLIDFFADCKPKPIKDNRVNMDDFFNHHVLIWENLVENKLSLEQLIRVPHSVDYTQ